MGAYQESKDYFDRALQLAMEIRAIPVVLHSLIGVADLFQREGKNGLAVRLLAFVTQQNESGQELRDHALALLPVCETGLPPQTASRHREWGRDKILEEMVSLAVGERFGEPQG